MTASQGCLHLNRYAEMLFQTLYKRECLIYEDTDLSDKGITLTQYLSTCHTITAGDHPWDNQATVYINLDMHSCY